MSSDIFVFDDPFSHHQHRHSSSIPFASEALLLSDPLSALSDSSIDSLLQEISDEPNAAAPMETQTAFSHVSMDEAHSLDQLSQTLLSNSLYDQTHFAALQNSADLPNGFANCPVSDVKTEESQFHLGFDSPPTSNPFFSGGDSVMIRFLQRSYSYGGHSYDGKKQGFLYQPTFTSLSESPETCFSNMRRVCSAGDLSKMKKNQTATQTVCSTHHGNESSSTTTFMEEANFKAARYSPEERKERIDRYRAKRTQRNFHKTIKYACRKTLADSRPRIRGRFARNDEPIETARPTNQYDDEDDLWFEGGDQGEQLMKQYGGSSQYCDQYIGY